MSTSTFHHHFRSMTNLSPLQFQKQLRLREARNLMLTEHLDAASASFEVGYESPSQFSREYSRLFGAPPLRDIMNLRQQSLSEGPESVLVRGINN
jgi:AraC-like DNA-binding protein